MALFISSRDISFFHHINRELLHDVISAEVALFKLNLNETSTNLYGESDKKTYYPGLYLYCLISLQEPTYGPEEQLSIDVNQQCTFAFRRKDLITGNMLPEVGDIVGWNGVYWEIDSASQIQLISGKNSDYPGHENTAEFGEDFSRVCNAHYTKLTSLQIEEFRGGYK